MYTWTGSTLLKSKHLFELLCHLNSLIILFLCGTSGIQHLLNGLTGVTLKRVTKLIELLEQIPLSLWELCLRLLILKQWIHGLTLLTYFQWQQDAV